MKRLFVIVAAAAVPFAVGIVSPHVASAHKIFPAGQCRVAIGWSFEPIGGTSTYAGQANAVQVFIDQPTATDPIGGPVGDLNSDCTKPDFTVTVAVGSTKSSPYCPSPVYDSDTARGRRDEYDSPITPTAVGAYTFHIAGKIHGVPIDQTIQSGASTFDSVADSTSSDFPVAVPPVSVLSTKIDAVDGRTANAQSSATSARSAATAGIIVGTAGVVLALISIGIAVFAMRTAARKP